LRVFIVLFFSKTPTRKQKFQFFFFAVFSIHIKIPYYSQKEMWLCFCGCVLCGTGSINNKYNSIILSTKKEEFSCLAPGPFGSWTNKQNNNFFNYILRPFRKLTKK
jgi:hypothetical protein